MTICPYMRSPKSGGMILAIFRFCNNFRPLVKNAKLYNVALGINLQFLIGKKNQILKLCFPKIYFLGPYWIGWFCDDILLILQKPTLRPRRPPAHTGFMIQRVPYHDYLSFLSHDHMSLNTSNYVPAVTYNALFLSNQAMFLPLMGILLQGVLGQHLSMNILLKEYEQEPSFGSLPNSHGPSSPIPSRVSRVHQAVSINEVRVIWLWLWHWLAVFAYSCYPAPAPGILLQRPILLLI